MTLWRHSFIVTLIALSLPAAWCNSLRAQAAVPPTVDADALHFNRTFWPADKVSGNTWTKNYLPIDEREFLELIGKAHTLPGGGGAAEAQLVRANYKAQLVDETLLMGEAEFEFKRQSQAPILFALSPCNLSIGATKWLDSPAPAVVGNAADGSMRVLLQGDKLSVRWSLRGEIDSSGTVHFRFKVPASQMARLELAGPGEIEFTSTDGILVAPDGTANVPPCVFLLSGRQAIEISANPKPTGGQTPGLILSRKEATYSITRHGLNLSVQLRLDFNGRPIEQLAVDLDSSLSLVGARYGETEISWTTSASAENPFTRVLLQLPEAISGTGRVVQLQAISPAVMDRLWRLPTVRVPDSTWQDASATLALRDGLELDDLQTNGCRQSRILPGSGGNESIEFQSYRPYATIDVLLSRPRDLNTVDVATMVAIGATDMVSRVGVELAAQHGERFTAKGVVAPGWTIDSVEPQGSTRLRDWEVEEDGWGPATLKILFQSPVTSAEPARFLVQGHRQLPATQTFESLQLQMLSFPEYQSLQRLVSVQSTAGSEVHWTDASDLSAASEAASSAWRLFPQPPSGVVYNDDAALSATTLSIVRRKPSFTADVDIDVLVQKNQILEKYLILCTPEAAQVDRLFVRFSEPRETPLTWSIAGANSGRFSAHKLSSAAQQQAGLASGGEAWEINLRLDRAGPFELRADRSIGFNATTSLALASVAQSSSQRGTLAIRGLGETGFSIRNRLLEPVPPELLEPDRYQTSRAFFHYRPDRDDRGMEPAVTIEPRAPEQAQTGAWAWSSRLDSRQVVDGNCLHLATFYLQTAGRQQVRALLPEGASLQAAWIDAHEASAAPGASRAGEFTFELPSGKSYATLAIEYTTNSRLPQFGGIRSPTWPRLDIPVFARHWTLWLPPGYVPIHEEPDTNQAVAGPSIRQRLFGFLGRDAAQSPFHPLSVDDWRRLTGANPDVAQSSNTCLQFTESLGALLSENFFQIDEGTLSWGELLSRCADFESQSGHTVLLDVNSLTWLGLMPQSRVSLQFGDSPLELGTSLLRQAGLVLLAYRNAIAITTNSASASYVTQFADRANILFVPLTPGPLADEMLAAAAGAERSHFQTAAMWRASPVRTRLPWTATDTSVIDPELSRQWSVFTYDVAGENVPQVRIVQSQAMSALSWAAFLAALAIGWWWLPRELAFQVLYLSGAAVLALLVSPAYSPLASAVFFAALILLLVRVLRRARLQQSQNSQLLSTVTKAVSQSLVLCIVISAFCMGPVTIAAAQQPGEVAPANPPVHQVVVPVDDNLQPVGGKYYVPADLYSALRRRATVASGSPQGWLITGANYLGVLSRDPASRNMGTTALQLQLDLTVLGPQTPVEVPFPHAADDEAPTAIRLDGQPIPLRWNAAKDALVVGMLDADRYRLQIELPVHIRAHVESMGFDVAIPPLANALLRLTTPADAPTIEVSSARGQVLVEKRPAQVTADLGPSDRISVRWPTSAVAGSLATNVEVEELIWARIRAGSPVVLDGRFTYKISGGQLPRIRLLVDPRLSLRPSIDPLSPIRAVIITSGDPQKIDLELNRGVTGEVSLDLSFAVSGTRGLGNLRLPRLETSGVRASRRWLAMSVDSALQHQDQHQADCVPLAVPDFLAAWGPAENRPLAAYAVPRGEASWELSTQPVEPRIAVEQIVAVDVARERAAMFAEANLSISRGFVFQVRLETAPGLKVDAVELWEQGDQRVSRWSSDEQGSLTVFFNAPITERQKLSLRGHIALPLGEEFVLPWMRLVGADTRSNILRLSRQAAVEVELAEQPALTEIPFDEFEIPGPTGALIGCYQSTDPHSIAKARVWPNAPEWRAKAITRLIRDRDRWLAELVYVVQVERGLVDTFEFEIPTQWTELRADPSATLQIVPVTGETRRQMIVVPARPVTGHYELTVRGRLLPGGERLRVPDIVPLGASDLQRYIVLPRSIETQDLAWETFGLVDAVLPAELAKDAVTNTEHVYRVAGDSFQAALLASERPGSAARVTLADIQMIWRTGGRSQGVAAFDLSASGEGSCVLQAPANSRIVHVTVEGLPAQLSAVPREFWRLPAPGDEKASDSWRVMLASRRLPQHIEVVFECDGGPDAAAGLLQAPRILELDVDQTLWTIYGPNELTPSESPSGKAVVSAAQHEMFRLAQFAAALEPLDDVAGHLPEELSRWYRPWRDRYAASRAMFDWKARSTGRTVDSVEQTKAQQLDERLATVDSRFGIATNTPRSEQAWLSAFRLLAASRAHERPTYLAFEGPADDVKLTVAAGDILNSRLRLYGAMTLFGLIGAFAWLRRHAESTTVPAWGVIAAIGAVWWAWLSPSVLGLLVIAAALLWVAHSQRDWFARLAN